MEASPRMDAWEMEARVRVAPEMVRDGGVGFLCEDRGPSGNGRDVGSWALLLLRDRVLGGTEPIIEFVPGLLAFLGNGNKIHEVEN